MNPLISIILPTYNGNKKWISESIQSVLDQTYTNFELIIINDASTNDIETTILAFAKKDERIKYYKNDENLQLTKTLNRGIELSKGEYIARIDDDDVWCDKDKLKKQIEFMENNGNYGLCGTNFIIIDHSGQEIEKMKQRQTDEEIRNHILQNNQFVHSSIMMRKSILEKSGFYRPAMNFAEDYDLRVRIGRISNFYNIEDSFIHYRINNQSISRKNSLKQKILAGQICLNNKKYYPNFFRAFILRIGDIIIPEKYRTSLIKFAQKIFNYS